MQDGPNTDQKQALIDQCLATYQTCRSTAAYCAGDDMTVARLLLDDCADIHLALSGLLTRNSSFQQHLAHLCANVSAACADALEAGEHHEAQLRVAYAACRGAHRACKAFAGDGKVASYSKQDEALKESFPASDPLPPPTEVG